MHSLTKRNQHLRPSFCYKNPFFLFTIIHHVVSEYSAQKSFSPPCNTPRGKQPVSESYKRKQSKATFYLYFPKKATLELSQSPRLNLIRTATKPCPHNLNWLMATYKLFQTGTRQTLPNQTKTTKIKNLLLQDLQKATNSPLT